MAVQWYTVDDEAAIERLDAAWEGTPVENLETLGALLASAQRQIIAYAPALGEGEEYPEEFSLAQLNLARNLWNDDKAAAGGGNIGADGFTYAPPPLPWKHLVRPVRVAPDVY